MMLIEYIQNMAARGRSCFSFKDVEKSTDSTPVAVRAALRRLQKKGDIAMPYKGFYTIVPPEYRTAGCIPPEQFIPDLMDYLDEAYYAGLLSAAEYHGAAHQRPQVFQVVVAKNRRPVECGKMKAEFIARKNIEKIKTEQRNTPAGVIKISTPETTALDLVGYIDHCGGLDNVATVLAELIEKIDVGRLLEQAEFSPIAWMQRLGYLMELAGGRGKAEKIAGYIAQKQPVRTPLDPSLSIKEAKMDNRWRVFVNTKVEPDI
jgi:predicted transcriptional regulator of viral defense system